MLQLFIDKQEVALPSDLKFDLFVYNPFFDRKSDYTYDIDIDLSIPQNARIYSHINRLNIVNNHKDRVAELYDGSKLILYGTEVILSIENNNAKIQLVSGNSELNYLAASKKARMRDLDLGVIFLNEITAKQSLESTSDTFDFVCPPCAKVYKRFGFSYWYNEGRSASLLYNNLSRPYYMDNEQNQMTMLNWCPQPNLRAMMYLCVVVEKVVQAMGYNVEYNALRINKKFKQVFIVNSTETSKVNEMVPNWLVNDFIDGVEKWCNVLFLVDQAKKTCSIVNISDFYNMDSATTFINKDSMVDGVEKDFNADPTREVSYSNIRYNVPNHEWYKYGDIDDNVRQACSVEEYATYEDIRRIGISGFYNQMTLFRAKDSGREYVISRRHNNTINADYNYLQPIDYVGKIVQEDTNDSMSFNIVPAPMVAVSLYGYYFYDGAINNNGGGYGSCFTMIPYAMDQVSEEEVTEGQGLNEFIVGGMSKEAIPDTMFVANYVGVQKCFWPNAQTHQAGAVQKVMWPLSLSVSQFVGFGASDSGSYIACNELFEDFDLSIKKLQSDVYAKNECIDTTKEDKLKFYTDEVLDSKKIFVVANARYYCRYIKYKVTIDGVSKEAEGFFFPMK